MLAESNIRGITLSLRAKRSVLTCPIAARLSIDSMTASADFTGWFFIPLSNTITQEAKIL